MVSACEEVEYGTYDDDDDDDDEKGEYECDDNMECDVVVVDASSS